MTTDRVQLLDNDSATGAWRPWPGGRGQYAVEGGFGGATVTLEIQGPNGSALGLGDEVALTAAGVANFEAPPGLVRAAVAGGTPQALYATAVRF